MSTVGWTRDVSQARLEDLRWMYDTGEHAAGAAQRLGLAYDALDKWARRNRVPFWAEMIRRKPADTFTSARARKAAQARWGAERGQEAS